MILQPLCHFATTLEVCFGSLSIWKTHLRLSFNFLTDVYMCCFNICTCSKAPHDMMLPRPCIMVGICLASITFSRRQLSKKQDICPHVQLKTLVWLFLMAVLEQWLFSLLSSISGYFEMTHFIVDIDNFVPVSSSSFKRFFAVCWD